jgi:hypothetical protein
LRQIANFHFNIKHSKLFDAAFQNPDEIVGDLHNCFSLAWWGLGIMLSMTTNLCVLCLKHWRGQGNSIWGGQVAILFGNLINLRNVHLFSPRFTPRPHKDALPNLRGIP